MRFIVASATTLLTLAFAQCSTPPLRTEVVREDVTKVQSTALIMVGLGAPDEPSVPLATALSIRQNMRNRAVEIEGVFKSRSGRISEQLAQALATKLNWKTTFGADLQKLPEYNALKTALPAQPLETGNPGFKKLVLAEGSLHVFPAAEADYVEYFLGNNRNLEVGQKICSALKTDSITLNYNRFVVSAVQDTSAAVVSLESTIFVVSKDGKLVAKATFTTPGAYLPIGQPDSYNQVLGLYGQWIGQLVEQIKAQSTAQ